MGNNFFVIVTDSERCGAKFMVSTQGPGPKWRITGTRRPHGSAGSKMVRTQSGQGSVKDGS